ncbi:MAG: UDP-N-acetylglucosamine 2-epimerase (non-hydrolyzing) [Pyrinomonadaceae bacterium]
MSHPSKILTIVGARPQFIKAAVVSRAMRAVPQLEEIIVHTGQHFDDNMSGVFFRELGIPEPRYNLGIDSLSHAVMTARMLEALDVIIIKENPHTVLVFGDTNSTLAGALAASKLNKKVAHVEAGLRSFDMRMPEEVNRVLTDKISDLLFCPTKTAVENLKREGSQNSPSRIIETGDVMFDAVLYHRDQAGLSPATIARLPKTLDDFVVCTLHRAENTDNVVNLSNILAALDRIHQTVPVLLLLHPRTRKKIAEYGLETAVWISEPVSYLEMIYLVARCRIVMTDSGGLQKEAFFLQKPCITLRENTEWTELVEQGVNFIVGSAQETTVETFSRCLKTNFDFGISPYGDGTAGEKIAAALLESAS